LVQVLAAALSLLPPHHHGEEAGLLALLAALGRVVPVDREPQVGHRGAAGRVAKLGGTGQVAHQENLVEVGHQAFSSTAAGCGFGVPRTRFLAGTRVVMKRSTCSLSLSCRSNSLMAAGSAETSTTAYVPSRCLRRSYASRRFPQLSDLPGAAPSPFSVSVSLPSSVGTSSSVTRGSMMSNISYGYRRLTSSNSPRMIGKALDHTTDAVVEHPPCPDD